jgi:acetyltransferase-like isoleucine patch superfamily enzyme
MNATREPPARNIVESQAVIESLSTSPREVVKAAARGLALLLAMPSLLSFWVRARLLGRDRALEGSCEALSLLPGLLGQYVRRAFLGRVLARCHSSACIGFGVLFSKAGTRLDENVYLGPRCQIGLAHIERDALLAAGVHVTSGARTHGFADLDTPIRDQAGEPTMVRIGAGAWIGSNAVVMADVGRNTVVGAGAVVTKPLPDGVIAAGVPARVLRRRDEVAT